MLKESEMITTTGEICAISIVVHRHHFHILCRKKNVVVLVLRTSPSIKSLKLRQDNGSQMNTNFLLGSNKSLLKTLKYEYFMIALRARKHWKSVFSKTLNSFFLCLSVVALVHKRTDLGGFSCSFSIEYYERTCKYDSLHHLCVASGCRSQQRQ